MAFLGEWRTGLVSFGGWDWEVAYDVTLDLFVSLSVVEAIVQWAWGWG